MAVERGIMPGGPDDPYPLPVLEVPVEDEMPDFSGGAEVDLGDDGSATVFDPTAQGVDVETEPYDHSANLAEIVDEKKLTTLAGELLELYKDDLASREQWEQVYEKGLELLGLEDEDRTEPFEGASGVTHPLLVEAVTAFQAQAYKELLPSGGPVDTKIIGKKTMVVEAQAARVKEFMNYEITEVMEEYDPGMDQLLYYLPLAGSAFKKVFYDTGSDEPRSDFIPAQDLVVPYGSLHLRKAPRITHRLSMTDNEVRKLQVSGFYNDIELQEGQGTDDPLKVDDKIDQLSGQEKPILSGTRLLLEMHAELDLDGFEDTDAEGDPTGIQLPYIITLDYESSKVLSIRRNWREEDNNRQKRSFFVHYKFMPGLGFYGFGFIHLLGSLGRSATAILRQLIDAGTLANFPGGFKARGMRVHDADKPIQPGEFRDIDAPGGNVRDALIPLPYKEPSQTLNLLLGALIDAGRRLTSISDPNTHDVNSQAPVGTTVALLERGTRVMSAIHKRLHRAQKTEFRLLGAVFAENLPTEYPFEVEGAPRTVMAQDFDGRIDIIPVSDPNIFSMSQRIALAQNGLQIAQSAPAIHNLNEAYRRMYTALGYPDIDGILPPPPPPPPPQDPAQENAALLNGQAPTVFPQQEHAAHLSNHVAMAKAPMIAQSPAAVSALFAHCLMHVSHLARQQVEEEIGAEQSRRAETGQRDMRQIQLAVQTGAVSPEVAQQHTMQLQETQQASQQGPDPDRMEALVAAKQEKLTAELLERMAEINPQMDDPLVNIRQRELDLREEKQELDADKEERRLLLERGKMKQSDVHTAARIESTETIAEERNRVNRERIQVQREAMRLGDKS